MRFNFPVRIYRLICAPHIDPDAPQILRATYAVTYVASVVSVLAFAPLFYFLGDATGTIAVLIYGTLAACTAIIFRLSGSLSFAWHWLSAWSFFLLAFLAYHQAGLSSPAAWWLPIVPIAQIAAGLNRSAVRWLVVGIIYLAVLFGVEQAGYPIGIYGRDNPPALIFVFFSIAGLAVIMMSFLLLLDKVRRQTFEQLRCSNAELEAARDAAIAAVNVKSRFLANMSHEIRTPMNGVLGSAQLLAETPLSNEQNQLMKTLTHSGEALLDLINDVLDFSKIEAGRLLPAHYVC